ncbi:helix-turn-helix domain-containing protein [Amycolatopsis sp. RTGN1]|uniref:helix-turn-helix domain-containing protein n=1 Tax=Amycolatopsis ponsaeliensis TaxID=2992142 RepID=UPI00254B79AB|nr:XRE family transcriptional regulator [Amycolatopsis sp. RTGN1]
MVQVRQWTGREAALLRQAMRMSIREFAAKLDVGVRTVNRWEARGVTVCPVPESQQILDATLGLVGEEVRERFLQGHRAAQLEAGIPAVAVDTRRPLAVQLGDSADALDGSPADTVGRIEEFTAKDMATRRSVLLGLSLLTGEQLVKQVQQWTASLPLVQVPTDRLGDDELAGLEQSVVFFRRWDAAGNGGLHRKAVVGQLNAVAEAVSQSASPATRRRLLQVVAELAQLAGWMTYDTGAFGLAQRYYLFALDACRHVEAADLGAKIVGDMTQMSTALGRYDDSVSLVRTAAARLPRNASALVRSELLGLEARACAQLGPAQASAALRAVDACVETFEGASTRDRPDWVHYLDQAEVECLAANAYTELALVDTRPARAATYAGRAEQHVINTVRAREGSYLRSRILDDLRLGRIRLAQQEPAEAAMIGLRAVQQAQGMRSTVVTKWLTGLAGPLNLRYGSVAEVSEFIDALTAYIQSVTAKGVL